MLLQNSWSAKIHSRQDVTIYTNYKYKSISNNMFNKSRDHYHEDGNLVPSPRCGFCFEAAFQL